MVTLGTLILAASVSFLPVSGHTKDDVIQVKKAEVKVNEVIQSQCFQDFFLKRKLIQTGGRTNQEVIDHIRSLNGSVPVVMYYKNNRVVGYRQPPDRTIYTNRKFHSGATPCNRGSNLGHEMLHSLGGYDHDFKATTRRPFSVPYSFNAAIAACCK